MGTFEMLDVAIGMIFIYLLLSMICSVINETIEAFLKMRAVDLERGIRELLQEPSGAGVTLVEKLYKHPLIYGLYKGTYDPKMIKDNKYKTRSNLPSYIPSKNFALALMDLVLPANPAGVPQSSGATGATDTISAELINAGEQSANSNRLLPLRNAINSTNSALAGNGNLQKALLSLIDAAGNDVVKARENLENWYNSSMDRVSGWYKRRVQLFTFILGIAAAVITNADSFAIFNSLVNDKAVRNAIVADASKQQNAQVKNENSPKLDDLENRILKYSLPIGWSSKNPHALPVDNKLIDWLAKIVGWIITGLAISLGAPFWFDLLNKVMVIRSTVKPHEKSKEEGSEDRQ
jgi:hypothetical protein